MRRPEAEELAESDAFPGAPHPRHASALIGHKAAEAEMLTAYRVGRLAHAWLIGGAEGVGKATLAWRFARFVLANPDPSAKAVRAAADLTVDPGNPAARHLDALAHPDFALILPRSTAYAPLPQATKAGAKVHPYPFTRNGHRRAHSHGAPEGGAASGCRGAPDRGHRAPLPR